MSEKGRVEIITIDCNDLEKVVGFWKELLGLAEKARLPGYVFLERVVAHGPRLGFQQVPEAKTVKNRVHLDLGAEDPDALVARAEQLGAHRVQAYDESGFRWTVMLDPEGNEFCIGMGS